ncbi:DUF3367 domain-containing protein [Corynebacterium callunae]|uniref:DUF3367 domain-containing protein n=1 Tax=Corynebacterium callunae TaxID=1721 RepID=UPI003981D9E7
MHNLARFPHFWAWILLGFLVFLQHPGQVSADTKLDLLLDPAGFLGGALHAWTDTFTMGQLQNQAYGYLFPQGFFFLITNFLPDWIAERLWWWLVLGVGFSGFLAVVSRLNIGSATFRFIAALLFALSPRTLTTLTAISSETWPIMVAPWVCLPLLNRHLTARAFALSLFPAACMGAVNATATMAALLPAAVILVYRLLPHPRRWWQVLVWGLGIIAVNSWWVGPLIVLGRYAPPFTEFIESASVTTAWLNPIEILRGTTSWTTFVDTERQAGYLLVNEPLFVMLSVLVAASGLAGLALLNRRGLWVFMLSIGLLILGSAHLPAVQTFLDGAGAPLRNIHKFDLLVRLPLMVGVAALGTHLSHFSRLSTRSPTSLTAPQPSPKRRAAGVLVVLVALGAIAPAWSGRLLPQGTWDEVPSYWYEATDFINHNAANTRTLIWPSSSFARQDWGWTRDEPAQPLLDVPWAVRDAIPLVPPEAIRGLDGLESLAESSAQVLPSESLKRLGIGVVLVRHDLSTDASPDVAIDGEKHTFGEVDVYILDPQRDMMLSDSTAVPAVAGGGEILALLDAINGYSPRTLTSADAEIVSDTPQLVGTNYGDGKSSAALASMEETEVKNRLVDYPSAGPTTQVISEGSLKASSSGSDATSLGGAIPDRSLNSLVDGRFNTAWFPTPGDTKPWLEVQGTGTTLSISPRDNVTVTVTSGDSVMVRELKKGESTALTLAEPSARLEFDHFVGISELSMEGVSRTITVPNTSPEVQKFIFQRLTVPTSFLDRAFTVPRDMEVNVDAQSCVNIELDGQTIDCGPLTLRAGTHMLRTQSEWVTFTESAPHTAVEPLSTIESAPTDRLLLTTRAFNSGSTALLDETPLQAVEIDAGAQAFVIPAGLSGELSFGFAGEKPYRLSLLLGMELAMLVLAIAAWVCSRRPATKEPWQDSGNAPWAAIFVIPMLGWWFIPALGAWLIVKFTLIPRWAVASVPLTVCGLWLTQAPWPAASYPGDSPALALLAGIGVLALFAPAAPQTQNSQQPPEL